MAEKRMLVLDADILKKIDDNRGDMSCADFINFLIDSRLQEGDAESSASEASRYVDKEEFYQFAQGIRDLLRNFLEFFISYGLELAKQPKDKALEELSAKIQSFESKAHK